MSVSKERKQELNRAAFARRQQQVTDTNPEWQEQFEGAANEKEHVNVPPSKRVVRKGAKNLHANSETIPANATGGNVNPRRKAGTNATKEK